MAINIGTTNYGNPQMVLEGSDVFGRRLAFNACLLLSAIFGLLVSIAPTYPTLCGCLFLLGSAIGVRGAINLLL